MEFGLSWIVFYENDNENENYHVLVKSNVIQNEKIDMVKVDFSNLSYFLNHNFTWLIVYRVKRRLFFIKNFILERIIALSERFHRRFWSRRKLPFSLFVFSLFLKRVWNRALKFIRIFEVLRTGLLLFCRSFYFHKHNSNIRIISSRSYILRFQFKCYVIIFQWQI